MRRNVFAALTAAFSMGLGGVALAQEAGSIVGDWFGTIDAGVPVPLVFHIVGRPGAWTATMDSPAQHAMGLQLNVSETDGKVRFELPVAHAAFDGARSPDGSALVGAWSQNGAVLPLTLHRPGATPAAAAPNRPQLPKAPFPYRSEEVGYDNPAQHNHLAGTLTLPPGKGPFPAVLLITGSGLQDRDETIFDHKPFLLWADTLTRRGVAVLRVDDRTMGGSTGEVRTATTADFATDVEAGVAYLKSRPEIDRRRIGLMGHSEGGVIAPMVAARDPSIAFVVLLAGPGETGEEVMLSQKRLIETAMGLPPAVVEASNASMKRAYEVMRTAPDQAASDAGLLALWRTQLQKAGKPLDTPYPPELKPLMSPWLRYFVAYDPRPALEKLRCPVLAVNGAKDLQVPPKENLPGIKAALHADPDATVIELPGLNHLLQTADTGQVGEYGKIEETISPLALRTVSDWIVVHAKP